MSVSRSSKGRRWDLPLCLGVTALLVAVSLRPAARRDDVPDRPPQAVPYLAAEAREAPPPYESAWNGEHNPGRCATCHARIFEQWNGSMMSNAWRDPAWRAAFLLVARMTSTAGDCDTPAPPDGSERAALNPFAGDGCSSTFELAGGRHTTARPGSLLDGFCSQCHMTSNYVDNMSIEAAGAPGPGGREASRLDPRYHPTGDAGTGIAFARVDARMLNTESGRRGIFCGVCHTMATTRDMPYGHVLASRQGAASPAAADPGAVPDPRSPSLGWAVGAGSFRLSPLAIASAEYRGPLAGGAEAGPGLGLGLGLGTADPYLSAVFGAEVRTEPGAFQGHRGTRSVLHERAEMCGACHDVTNALPLRNRLGRWVGGFPIERTYSEWSASRYAARPGNARFDPRFQRDCQTCHMQQDYGRPGTAQTLYRDGRPAPPLAGRPSEQGPERKVFFSHHFIGGNTYVPHLIGADVDAAGTSQPYPQLSTFSFSSADPKSPYHNAYWTGVSGRGPATQHARLAWDRLRNVVDLELAGPRTAAAGGRAPLRIAVVNSGSGHDFPSGFPEGRTAWLAVRAFDLASGRELDIYDGRRRRTSRGVGYLTAADGPDPNFPGCAGWELPAGSPDPYAVQWKAVASLGDGCPTLDLPYATPLNLVVDRRGRPLDAAGRVIDAGNPAGVPQFRDLDGDGDLFDDSFLVDTRLRPLPHAGARVDVGRYSVEIPPGTRGPVAVVAAVYYQSLEAVVAKKFLGNLADRDLDFRLEPCVLGGACDGRTPAAEPAVVEGSPPVPMEVRDWVIEIAGAGAGAGAGDNPDRTPPGLAAAYPRAGAEGVYRDAVVKATFTEPVSGVDAASFTLADGEGRPVPAFVDQIGDGTWGLFPHAVHLRPGAVYTARLPAGIRDRAGNAMKRPREWSFRTAPAGEEGSGDTGVPAGFPAAGPRPDPPPAVRALGRTAGGGVAIAFSEPVMNVQDLTVEVRRAGAGGCAASDGRAAARLAGRFNSNPAGDRWTWEPARPLPRGEAVCLAVSAGVYDLAGQGLASPFRGPVR